MSVQHLNITYSYVRFVGYKSSYIVLVDMPSDPISTCPHSTMGVNNYRSSTHHPSWAPSKWASVQIEESWQKSCVSMVSNDVHTKVAIDCVFNSIEYESTHGESKQAQNHVMFPRQSCAWSRVCAT
jgi:hypothetical protein